MEYKYVGDKKKTLARLEALLKSEIEGSVILSDCNTKMFTPDGMGSYHALWTRDFEYHLEGAPRLISKEDAIAALDYTLDHAREDGWMPDRVYQNGFTMYVAGREDEPELYPANLDNNSYAALSFCAVLDKIKDEKEKKAYFNSRKKKIIRALDVMPKAPCGLIYNDPLDPHSPYGYTDTIGKTGLLCFESLLYYRACKTFAAKCKKMGDAKNANIYTCAYKLIEASFEATFLRSDGFLSAATGDCAQPDVWATAYALSLCFPLSEGAKKAMTDALVSNCDSITYHGQIRHLAYGQYWEKLLWHNYEKGEYQNGAFWSTASGWFIDAVYKKDPALAMKLLDEVVAYFFELGIYECINEGYQKLPHYVSAISTLMPIARKLLK